MDYENIKNNVMLNADAKGYLISEVQEPIVKNLSSEMKDLYEPIEIYVNREDGSEVGKLTRRTYLVKNDGDACVDFKNTYDASCPVNKNLDKSMFKEKDKDLVERVLNFLEESGLPARIAGGTASAYLQGNPQSYGDDVDILVEKEYDQEINIQGGRVVPNENYELANKRGKALMKLIRSDERVLTEEREELGLGDVVYNQFQRGASYCGVNVGHTFKITDGDAVVDLNFEGSDHAMNKLKVGNYELPILDTKYEIDSKTELESSKINPDNSDIKDLSKDNIDYDSVNLYEIHDNAKERIARELMIDHSKEEDSQE